MADNVAGKIADAVRSVPGHTILVTVLIITGLGIWGIFSVILKIIEKYGQMSQTFYLSCLGFLGIIVLLVLLCWYGTTRILKEPKDAGTAKRAPKAHETKEPISIYREEKLDETRETAKKKIREYLQVGEERLREATEIQKSGDLRFANKIFNAGRDCFSSACIAKPDLASALLGKAKCIEGLGKTDQEGKNFQILLDALDEYEKVVQKCEDIIAIELDIDKKTSTATCRAQAMQLKSDLKKYLLDTKYREEYVKHLERKKEVQENLDQQ